MAQDLLEFPKWQIRHAYKGFWISPKDVTNPATWRRSPLVPSIPLFLQNWDFCPEPQPGSAYDSNFCLSKAAGYCIMGSFHPEQFKPRKLNLWMPGCQHGFSQGVFHETLVPWNVHSCWVIVGLSNDFEEHWHFEHIFFFWGHLCLSHAGSLRLQGTVRMCSFSNLFDHSALLCLWDLVFWSSALQTFTYTWFTPGGVLRYSLWVRRSWD